jgi:hypothetical protein
MLLTRNFGRPPAHNCGTADLALERHSKEITVRDTESGTRRETVSPLALVVD